MAKEDFCFTYYDGDAARDMAHMNRLERGGYSDLIVSQRKFGRLSLLLIKKTLGNDFNSIWEAIEIILKKDEEGKFFIEWVEESIRKMKKQSIHQTENGKKGGRPKNEIKANNNPSETQTIDKKKPLEDENGNEDEKENDLKGVQGENEIPIGFQMQQTFSTANPTYPPKPSADMPAIMEIAAFILQQRLGTKKEMFEMDVGERKTVIGEWGKWCIWYQSYGNNKSLEFLAKFKMQEIFLEIKNGRKNGEAGRKYTGPNGSNGSNKKSWDSEDAAGF